MPAPFRRTHAHEALPVLPLPKAEMEKRIVYAQAHPYEPHRTAGPTCTQCKSAVYARIIHKFGVPELESICVGGHSEYLGRFRSDGYFAASVAA